MAEITLTYARADKERADLIVKKLESLGFTVRRDEAAARGARRQKPYASTKRVLLWSRHYAASHGAGARASTLVTARLDTAPLPAMLRSPVIDLRAWRGRDDHRGWRALAAQVRVATAPQGAKPAHAARRAPAAPVKPKNGGMAPKLLWLAGAVTAAAGGAAAFMTMH